MATESKRCKVCNTILIFKGIHMGIPFSKWRYFDVPGEWKSSLICSGCYDTVTVKDNVGL